MKEAAPRCGRGRWLWVFNSLDGWHEVGDGAVGLVGEEQYGLEMVVEVEDDRGYKRFWGRDENFFRGQGARRADRAEGRIEVCGFGKLVSCGDSGERGRRTELDLGSGKSVDDHHAAATFGTEPKWARFLGRGGFWFGVRWRYGSE